MNAGGVSPNSLEFPELLRNSELRTLKGTKCY